MENLNAHEIKLIKDLLSNQRDILVDNRYRYQIGKGDPDTVRRYTIKINELENILLKI